METILISLCIAICGGTIGFIFGYRSGSSDMDRNYKEAYNIKDYQSRAGDQLNWLEPSAHNGVVVGSSPTSPTNCPRDGMVDITDLKSVAFMACRFESGRGYQILLLTPQLSWIEQVPSKHQVGGSNPPGVAKSI